MIQRFILDLAAMHMHIIYRYIPHSIGIELIYDLVLRELSISLASLLNPTSCRVSIRADH